QSRRLFSRLRGAVFLSDAPFDGDAKMDRQALTPESGRAGLLKNYVLLNYTAAALAVLIGVATLISSNHNVRFDLTPTKRFTLSEFDKHVLADLKRNVRVMCF